MDIKCANILLRPRCPVDLGDVASSTVTSDARILATHDVVLADFGESVLLDSSLPMFSTGDKVFHSDADCDIESSGNFDSWNNVNKDCSVRAGKKRRWCETCQRTALRAIAGRPRGTEVIRSPEMLLVGRNHR